MSIERKQAQRKVYNTLLSCIPFVTDVRECKVICGWIREYQEQMSRSQFESLYAWLAQATLHHIVSPFGLFA